MGVFKTNNSRNKTDCMRFFKERNTTIILFENFAKF